MSVMETVVVGVDGSAESCAALAHALEDAGRRGARLRVVTAVRLPEFWATAYGMPMPPPPGELLADARANAQRWVNQVVADRAVPAPHVQIDVEAVDGSPATVLLDAARDADLLVIGHRGRGGVASALLGSVGLRCVLHATCPVTIVRSAPAAAGISQPEAASTGADRPLTPML